MLAPLLSYDGGGGHCAKWSAGSVLATMLSYDGELTPSSSACVCVKVQSMVPRGLISRSQICKLVSTCKTTEVPELAARTCADCGWCA